MIPVIFTSPTCMPCKAVKRWLDSNNVMYEERNGADYIDEIKELTGRASVPVLVYKEYVITGFDVAALREAFPV